MEEDNRLRFYRECYSCNTYNWCFVEDNEWICDEDCARDLWMPQLGEEE